MNKMVGEGTGWSGWGGVLTASLSWLSDGVEEKDQSTESFHWQGEAALSQRVACVWKKGTWFTDDVVVVVVERSHTSCPPRFDIAS